MIEAYDSIIKVERCARSAHDNVEIHGTIT